MKTVLTLSEVLARARKLGVKCSESAFWKYYKLGLVPKGEKLPGRGNVLYFPDGTHHCLHWVVCLKEVTGSLEEIRDVMEAHPRGINGFLGPVQTVTSVSTVPEDLRKARRAVGKKLGQEMEKVFGEERKARAGGKKVKK